MFLKKERVLLVLACVPLFFLNVHDAFSFGDDWAQYMQEGLNIAQGRPFYSSLWIYNNWNTDYAPANTPPGYPLLMAPVAYWFGFSIIHQVYLNILFCCLILFAGYYFFNRYLQKPAAFSLAVVLAYLPLIIDLKGHLLSDIPCTAFTLLYLALRVRSENRRLLFFAPLGCLLSFTVLIRTQSVIIIFSELTMILLTLFRYGGRSVLFRKYLHDSVSIIISAVIFLLIWNMIIFPAPVSGLPFYINLYRVAIERGDVGTILGYNVQYLFDILLDILRHRSGHRILQVIISVITVSSVVLAVIGLLKRIRQGIDVPVLFFLFMCLLIIVTPVYQGLRYFLPAVPVFLLLAAQGTGMVVSLFSALASRLVALCFVAVFLLLGFEDYEKSTHIDMELAMDGLDSAAFRFVCRNVGDSDIVVSSKPRLLTLFSGKRTVNMSWQENVWVNKQYLDSLGAKFLLYARHLNIPVMDEYIRLSPPVYYDSAVINERYTLFYLNQK